VLPERLFRRLDRARLDDGLLALGGETFERHVLAVAQARDEYASHGRVRPLHLTSQALTAHLDGLFDLPRVPVFLRDRPRPHRRQGGRIVYEVFGLCEQDGPLEVYTRTPARAQPVALRTFLDTLLHEWVHHFDFARFDESVHNKGFYERCKQLELPSRAALALGGH
jgi:hypothetical protein